MSVLREYDRRKFIEHLKHFVHPSTEISLPEQLKGREGQLRLLRDCFETEGENAFVWGLRGVGKTSLVHTACNEFDDVVQLAAVVGCEKHSTVTGLFNDIFRRIVQGGKVKVKEGSISAKLSAFGLTLDGQTGGFREQVDVQSVNYASDLLATVLPVDHQHGRSWVVIVDEFDLLQDRSVIDFFTALAKQLSVDGVPVKFAFCGVASSLNELIGSHESVDRYIKAIPLEPLLDGHILEIVDYIAENFDISLNRGQRYRIAQIACGYAHFAHVIMKEVLRAAFDEDNPKVEISDEIFKTAVQNAAQGAATRLQDAYEKATRKGSDRYIEVIWSVADGQLLTKQFKTIRSDYLRIMESRSEREALDDERLFRNHLNALCKESNGSILRREKTGWYSFNDPMLRSYVRLMAHNAEVNLGAESFSN